MQHISLASGASYFRSPEAATSAAIQALQAGATHYGPTEGIASLRTAIANRYKGEGIDVSPDHVLITPGSKHALHNLFSVLLHEGDEVVVPIPAWFGFHELLRYSKGTRVALPTSMESDYALTPEALRQALTPRSRILLLTNPGNPTGRLYSKQELEAILAVAADYHNLYVVSDEIYDFVTYGRACPCILSCQGATERVVVVNGFSKSFAMSGWRVGYLVGAPDMIRKCTDFQGATVSGVSPFVQEAALATMQDRQTALAAMLPGLLQNRSLMQEAFDRLPQVRYVLPEGAYYFFPDFSYYLGRSTPQGIKISSGIDLCSYLREACALEVVPGEHFGAPGHARLSFAVEQSILQEAMHRLENGLLALKS